MKKKLLLIILFITLCPATVFASTSMPVLNLVGNINNMNDKSDVRTVEFTYTEGSKSYSGGAKLKIQGASSTAYPKKNFNITFYEDTTLAKKKKINIKWGKQSKYTLKANYIDTKTNARNIVTAKIAASIQKEYHVLDQAPNNGLIDGFPIIIKNNGAFYGIYTLNIPKDDWLFAMDDKNENHLLFSSNDWSEPAMFWKKTTLGGTWEFEVGDETQANIDKLNRVIDFVLYSSDDDFKNYINEYFDFDSLLTYYIMCYYAYLGDNRGKNMLLATYDGQVWYTSLYDLDTSWGTNWDLSGSLTNNNGSDAYKYIFNLGTNNLFRRLYNNFPTEIADRYFALRQNILTKNNVMGEFNTFYNKITADAFTQEVNKWGPLHGEGLNQIERFLNDRESVLDNYFNEYYSYTYVPIINIAIDNYGDVENGAKRHFKVVYNPTNTNADKKVTWTSSNKNVATVDSNGYVYGVSEGTTKICATVQVRYKNCVDIHVSGNLTQYVNDTGLTQHNAIVDGFTVGTSIEDLRNSFGGKVVFDTQLSKIGTGVRLVLNNEVKYAVVYGDLNGDAEIDSGDLLRMRQHLLGKSWLEGPYWEAGLVSHGNNIDSADLLRLKQYLLGINSIEQ